MEDGAIAYEQQERLRRFVDEWRDQVWKLGGAASPCNADPIGLALTLCESGVSLPKMIVSDNATVNKVLMPLAFDCVEISRFRREALEKIYPRLLVFGDSDKASLEGSVQLAFARWYGFFHELKTSIVGLRGLLGNLFRQLQALYSPLSRKKQTFSTLSSVHFHTAISSLGEGLGILMILDEIVSHNGAIGHSLSLFTRMLQSVRAEPDSFDVEANQIESLHRAVSEMDDLLVTGLFQRCIHEDFSLQLEKEELKDNALFLEEVSFGLRTAIVKVLNAIETSKEQPDDREKLVGLLGVFVLYSWISGEASDKKTLKMISKLAANFPVLHPVSNVRFLSIEFLSAHSPSWFRASTLFRDVRRDAAILKRSYLTRLDEALIKDSHETHRSICDWLVSFSTLAASSPNLSSQSLLDRHLQQATLGILLANKLQKFLRSAIDLHVLLEVPISKEQVRQLRYGMELLKAIEYMFNKLRQEVALSVGQIVGHLMSVVRERLLQFKSWLAEDLNSKLKTSNGNMFNRSPSKTREPELKLMDALCALNITMKALDFLPTVQGLFTFRLAFDVVTCLQTKLQEERIKEIEDYIALIELTLNRGSLIQMATDCSFLFWNKEMMATCFAMVYSQAGEARHLQYLVSAFLDGAKLLQCGCADASLYEKSIRDCLLTEVVEPICHDIETDLRLHVHSAHLKGAVNVNPTKTGVRDPSWFLKIKPLRLLSSFIHIKSRVEVYLNAAFYDHAAVALHNWKTYNEMKNIAELKYGLSLDAIHLPGQTLEQGVDVLEIMRNIHIFVACYTYNLNTQVFVERPSNARNRKNLNTVNVKHAANSIRTHGIGIMSTTVNFAYQFLAQKFLVFSQFLFDDHIKSRMVKEQRFYKEKKLQADSGYPVERAEKLNKDIRKLGVTDDGFSFLDQFRRLIAEMGNALGFVRMVRLGGLNYCTTACGSLPMTKGFEEAAKTFFLPKAGIDAGLILDKALESQNLSVNETDYFAILTNIFSELKGNDNIHLRDFFLLVPALTINAADAILQSKEKLHKRGRDAVNATFTDDGFALGIAYILKVLDQDKQFDSLHWFQSARQHFVAERARLEESLDMDSTGSGMNGLQAWSQKLASLSKEEAQNMEMMMKKITAILMEVELIEFTFTGARVFFQGS
ncbi:WASH complex subunit 4 isoform X2 [Selaginella moellendorffii]|uniref:WASH complex subunit 4 isoform X2 n=1 Tax=Selaginella moellendorffii TaxID=88036 RepID=UPI000D1C6EC3|nr:WASH complex subunit 4 isoform X2 [Selaginella moellendorffii]|eukprot:XP_024536240.1 WASH complex subunit 4 isoform X2 [Selaginella moellendorffii]